MVADTVRQFGRLDLAVSNAAFSEREYFHEADLDGFRKTVDVTMWGAFHLTRAAARQMIQSKTPGCITIVSSPHAFLPAPRAMAYNMSKAAIEQMAKTAAIELAEHRIRVNIIQPGWTDTPGERKFADEDTLAWVDDNGDGVPELILQFDAGAVERALAGSRSPLVTIDGEVLDTIWFGSSRYLRGVAVIDPVGGQP